MLDISKRRPVTINGWQTFAWREDDGTYSIGRDAKEIGWTGKTVQRAQFMGGFYESPLLTEDDVQKYFGHH